MSPESFDEAFRTLLGERYAPLYRYVDSVSGDAALAADIAQECFVRLYRRGTVPDDAGAWLATVANNLLRDHNRRAARRRRLIRLWRDDVPLSGTARPADDSTIAAERVETVRRALDRLSPRDRQLLLLRHQGYRYQEIARILDLNPGSIGTMLARASESFRKVYDELFGTPR